MVYKGDGFQVRRVLGGRSNVFLVIAGSLSILVDSGPASERRSLIRALEGQGIRELDHIFLTHAHYDHTGNCAMLKEGYGGQVLIQEKEAEDLKKGGNPEIRGTNAFARGISRLASSGRRREILAYTPCVPDIIFREELDLSNQGVEVIAIHTPGHTEGSSSLIVNREIALVGDCMFGMFPNSVFPPFAVDVDLMLQSWGRLLETGCQWYLPSHGRPKTREQLRADYEKRKSFFHG